MLTPMGSPEDPSPSAPPVALMPALRGFAFDLLAYNSEQRGPVNYIAHFSGFAAGIAFRILLWRVFTTEKPEPRRRPASVRR